MEITIIATPQEVCSRTRYSEIWEVISTWHDSGGNSTRDSNKDTLLSEWDRATGTIRAHDFLIRRHVLYQCALTTAKETNCNKTQKAGLFEADLMGMRLPLLKWSLTVAAFRQSFLGKTSRLVSRSRVLRTWFLELLIILMTQQGHPHPCRRLLWSFNKDTSVYNRINSFLILDQLCHVAD